MSVFSGIVLFLAFIKPSYAQRGLERQMLVDIHGNELTAFQNPITKSPHRIMSHGVKIDRYFAGAVSLQKGNVEAISTSFIADYKDLLKVNMSDLEFKEASQGSGNWYVTFQQRHQRIPVYKAYVSFTVDPNWNVILMGSDSHPQINVSTTPLVSEDEAVVLATERLGSLDVIVDDHPALFIFPKETNNRIEYHLTWKLGLSSEKPSKGMMYFIDAIDGKVVEEWSTILEADRKIYGKVQGNVKLKYYNEADVVRGFRHEKVAVDDSVGEVKSGNTNTNGDYDLSWVGNSQDYWLRSYLDGPYVKVLDDLGSDSFHELGPVTPNPIIQHNWTWNEDIEENTTFYHINFARDHWNSYRTINFKVTAHVDFNMQSCASASTTKIIKLGKNCVASLTSDVIYHEYGHEFIFDIYGWQSIGTGSYSEGRAMDEGFADYAACTINNDSQQGENVPPYNSRDLNNTKTYADFETTGSGPPHSNGLIIGGAVWDLREQLGQSTTDALWVEAMEITPRPDTFVEFCENMLLADDNDANLSNGTPNDTKILDAFSNKEISPRTIYVPAYYTNINIAVLNAWPEAAGTRVLVSIASGTYDQGSVNMKSKVDLKKGSGTVTITGPSNGVGVIIYGDSDILIENITIGSDLVNAVEVINSGSSIVFRNCDFQGGTFSGSAGIYVSGGSSTPRLDNCSFQGAYYGIHVNNDFLDVFPSCDIYDSSYGVYCVNQGVPWLYNNNNFSYPSPHNSVYDVYAASDVNSSINAQGNFWGYVSGSSGPLRDPVVFHGVDPPFSVQTAGSRSTPAKIVVDTSPIAVAQEKLRSGDRSGAKADFKTIIASSTSQQETRTAIHWVMFASQTADEVEEALSYLNSLQNQSGTEGKAAALYVSISGLVSQGRPAEALSRIDQILRDHPTSPYVPYALLEKAFLLDYTYNDYNGATEIFSQIAATYPDWTETMMVKAKLAGRTLVQGGAKNAEPVVSLSSFPNPANPTTTIRFELPLTDHVSMVIYNLLGQSMRTLLDDVVFGPGAHSVVWNGHDDRGQLVGSGMYIARLKANGQVSTRKLMLMR